MRLDQKSAINSVTRTGFSVVELTVVIAVLGLLIGLLMSAVQHVRAAASRIQCANNMKQLGLALHGYEATFQRFPPHRPATESELPERLLGWEAIVLPYVEQDGLWEASIRACKQTTVTYRNPPHVGYATVIRLFVCPNDSRFLTPQTTPSGDFAAFSSYLGVSGSLNKPGVLGPPGVAGASMHEIRDGTSSTLLVGERPPPDSLQAGRWYSGYYVLEPFGGPDCTMPIPSSKSIFDVQCSLAGSNFGPGDIRNPCDRFHYWSLHNAGANFVFADGSVRFLSYSATNLMPALATRDGGEVVELE